MGTESKWYSIKIQLNAKEGNIGVNEGQKGIRYTENK
jgi:hypothetical protein